MYQLPHRSFAINGSEYASDTAQTKEESASIDCNRFGIDSVRCFNCDKVWEVDVAWEGKIKEERADMAGCQLQPGQ